MQKKGVEMSLNVIIIAAIGLLILLILAFLVVKNVSNVTHVQQTDCATNSGLCTTNVCTTKTVPNTNCPTGQTCFTIV
jgi:large-conductance mechanosensitive channel